jgi:hypothetical protein
MERGWRIDVGFRYLICRMYQILPQITPRLYQLLTTPPAIDPFYTAATIPGA